MWQEKIMYTSCAFHLTLTHSLQPMDVGIFHPMKQCYYNILKEYKIQRMAENVTKNLFPPLIKQLWDNSFKERHIILGFRAAGLHPLNQNVIKDSKLATGVPFQQLKDPVAPTTVVQVSSPIALRSSCKSCGADITPMHAYLTWYFTKILQKKHQEKSSKMKKESEVNLAMERH